MIPTRPGPRANHCSPVVAKFSQWGFVALWYFSLHSLDRRTATSGAFTGLLSETQRRVTLSKLPYITVYSLIGGLVASQNVTLGIRIMPQPCRCKYRQYFRLKYIGYAGSSYHSTTLCISENTFALVGNKYCVINSQYIARLLLCPGWKHTTTHLPYDVDPWECSENFRG